MYAQACNRQTVYCVPLYDSLGENALEYIITHAEVTYCFVQSEKLGQLAKALAKVNGLVKHVVYWGAPDSSAIEVHSHTTCPLEEPFFAQELAN